MRDTIIWTAVALGIALGWVVLRDLNTIPTSSTSISASRVSSPKSLTQKGANNERASSERHKPNPLIGQGSRSSGDSAEIEELSSIYPHQQRQQERAKLKTVKKRSAHVAGVPIEAYVHSYAGARGLPAVPAPMESNLTVYLQCLEMTNDGKLQNQGKCAQLYQKGNEQIASETRSYQYR